MNRTFWLEGAACFLLMFLFVYAFLTVAADPVEAPPVVPASLPSAH